MCVFFLYEGKFVHLYSSNKGHKYDDCILLKQNNVKNHMELQALFFI